jgi:hypothetical protein
MFGIFRRVLLYLKVLRLRPVVILIWSSGGMIMAWKTKLQIEIDKNYTENVCSHRKENKIRLHYKEKLVNAVHRNNLC